VVYITRNRICYKCSSKQFNGRICIIIIAIVQTKGRITGNMKAVISAISSHNMSAQQQIDYLNRVYQLFGSSTQFKSTFFINYKAIC